jgi:hypothetical protein
MDVTIPGALADYLADTNLATGADDHDPASKATREALDAGRRGRGRTLVITPKSTDVLKVISEYAEGILNIRGEFTRAERDAARKWIALAGHARKQLTTEQAETAAEAVEEQAAHASADNYIARNHPDVTALLSNDARLIALRDAITATGGTWTTKRVDETLRAAGKPTDINSCWGLLRHLAATEEGLTETGKGAFTAPEPGTWQTAWLGKQAAAPALFNLAPTSAEQGALFQ